MQQLKNALIIFVRNAEYGKVKTRLAVSIGEANALKVYQVLITHTREITRSLNCDKFVFYSESLNEQDLWENDFFFKRLQRGESLGERMKNAFNEIFRLGYQHVSIIGSDCYELTTDIIREAFEQLSLNDVAIGPAKDGGYYLLGMKKLHEILFDNKSWSSQSVFSDTLNDIREIGLSFFTMQVLRDVDEVKDISFKY